MLYYENYNYTKLFIIDSVIYDPNIYFTLQYRYRSNWKKETTMKKKKENIK